MPFTKRITCCNRKRSENDILFDPVDKQVYCAACWQEWLHSHSSLPSSDKIFQFRTVSFKQEKSGQSTDKCCKDVSDDAVDACEVLEGVVHTDGNLYLLDKTRNSVYSTERTDSGDLVSVGVFMNGEINLFDALKARSKFPFESDPADNCETPLKAYEDLAPVLRKLSGLMKKKPENLRIYDPYFCDGGVKRKLAGLGFLSVHNECNDFYHMLATNQLPDYDCVITNPPYSGDHIERLFKFLTKQSKPWFVVQPNFVYTKPYWESINASSPNSPRPFFLTPDTPRKYVYNTPKGLRAVKAQKLRTSPFVTMWFCWTGKLYTADLYKWWTISLHNSVNLGLFCSEFFLPDSFKDSNDPSRRKNRKRKRKAD